MLPQHKSKFESSVIDDIVTVDFHVQVGIESGHIDTSGGTAPSFLFSGAPQVATVGVSCRVSFCGVTVTPT